LNFENAIIYEPFELGRSNFTGWKIDDKNPFDWSLVVQYHDGQIPELLLFHLVAKTVPAARRAAGAVLGLFFTSE